MIQTVTVMRVDVRARMDKFSLESDKYNGISTYLQMRWSLKKFKKNEIVET